MKSIGLLYAAMAVACAQTPRATVTGRVFDPSHAVIAYAEVRAAPGYAVMAGREGQYRLSLPPGDYTVTAAAAGFETFSGPLSLAGGQNATFDITLEISAITEQITVTAKAPPLEGSPETMTSNVREVLEIREVRESGARDMGEALARLDGVWKIRKGGIANDVVLRGFQQGNINVLVDGERIYGACPNHMDPAAFHVDFAEIQHVEVTKGAFDIRDQGSLGGVVNIVTKTPRAGLRITPSLATGSFGYFNPSLTASWAGEKTHFLAGHSFRRSSPYLDGRGKPFTDYANFSRPPRDAFHINTAWFKTGFQPAEGHRVELGYTRQASGAVLYPYLMMDAPYDNADRVNASYQAGIFRLQSYFTRVKHWMTDEFRASAAGTPRSYSMATFAATKTMGARAQAGTSNFKAGFETYRRNWNAVNTMRMMGNYVDQPSIPDVNLTAAGAYGEYQRVLGRLRFTSGARMDGAHSVARSASLSTDLFWAYKGTRSVSATDWLPSANGSLAYTVTDPLELFAGVGHAARPPDPVERYFALKRGGSDWVGNPNLRPTRNTEVDVGVNYRGRRFSLRPTLYYSSLDGYINVHNQAKINPLMSVMNAVARSYENVQARMYGGEVTYSVGFSPALLLSGGLAWTRGIKETGGNLAEMPPLKSRASLRYGRKRFFAEVEGLAARRQTSVDGVLREQPTAGYAVMNFKAGVHTGKLNLAAGIDNLFDRFYYEYLSFQRDPFRTGVRVPEPGRNLYLAVSYAF